MEQRHRLGQQSKSIGCLKKVHSRGRYEAGEEGYAECLSYLKGSLKKNNYDGFLYTIRDPTAQLGKELVYFANMGE